MPEPTSSAAAVATVVAAGATLPALTLVQALAPQIVVFGIALGLRADVLLAGFSGAVVAIGFFNTVPSTGDTWRELVRTTVRRMWYALASALSAGYMVPLAVLIVESSGARVVDAVLVSMAFVAGAGAQRFLGRFIKGGEAKIDAADRAIGGGNVS